MIGLDSLGFDLRLCAGAKIESLRFAFSTRVSQFSTWFLFLMFK